MSDPSDLSKKTFYRHASVAQDGDKYLNLEDFLNAIAPPNEDYHKISRNSYAVLFQVADRTHKGLVSLKDWHAFETLLDRPDAEYLIAFKLFDQEGRGEVDFDKFVELYKANRSPDALPFDWNSKWASLYLGDSRKRHSLSYQMFSQMLSGLMGERVRQAFQHYDRDNTGYITPDQFQEILSKTAAHKLSDTMLDNLHTLCNASHSSRVSYAQVRAFLNVIRNVDLLDIVANNATQKSKDGTITREDFMTEAARSTKFSLFTPLEVEVLFHFVSIINPTGRLSLDDFRRVFDPTWQDPYTRYRQSEQIKVDAAKNALVNPSSFLGEVFESVYNFALGSLAGAFGATVVYPIDLVKTRMQNQRSATPGQQLLYKNSWDCFKKVITREGFKGLYSGLGPQLIGVAPEKAIKLTANDLVRGKLTNKDGVLPVWAEVVAGGTAGACQVVFTNPLEIVKIRLQVQGELAKSGVEGAQRRSALWIIRHLGLVGLYKGASACLLRDVPFSAIYFPAYAHLKKDYFGEGPTKQLNIGQLLVAGAIAGIPAAYFTTPCDVIKTRLQVEARKGQTSYRGLTHAATTIMKEEGFQAFFKGGPARVLRSSPQFGCTLAAYEFLKQIMPLPGTIHKTEAGHVQPSSQARPEPPVKYLRSRNALKILLDIDKNFGKPGTLTADKAKLIPGLKTNN